MESVVNCHHNSGNGNHWQEHSHKSCATRPSRRPTPIAGACSWAGGNWSQWPLLFGMYIQEQSLSVYASEHGQERCAPTMRQAPQVPRRYSTSARGYTQKQQNNFLTKKILRLNCVRLKKAVMDGRFHLSVPLMWIFPREQQFASIFPAADSVSLAMEQISRFLET